MNSCALGNSARDLTRGRTARPASRDYIVVARRLEGQFGLRPRWRLRHVPMASSRKTRIVRRDVRCRCTVEGGMVIRGSQWRCNRHRDHHAPSQRSALRLDGPGRSSTPFMPSRTTNSIRSVISSRGKSIGGDALLPWPAGLLWRHRSPPARSRSRCMSTLL
jgi:hypothetical protein